MLPADNKNSRHAPLVLLHECEFMVRKTFGLFASETNLAEVIETSEIRQAKIKLSAQPFDVIILGFDAWLEEIHLIQLIRDNMTLSDKNVPIITILPNVTTNQIDELKQLSVNEIILKPARIKTIQKAFMNSYKQLGMPPTNSLYVVNT